MEIKIFAIIVTTGTANGMNLEDFLDNQAQLTDVPDTSQDESSWQMLDVPDGLA